jgi:aspartate-semialdehyde dehydrogenase
LIIDNLQGVRSQESEYLFVVRINRRKFVHQLSIMTQTLSFILNPVFCILNPDDNCLINCLIPGLKPLLDRRKKAKISYFPIFSLAPQER